MVRTVLPGSTDEPGVWFASSGLDRGALRVGAQVAKHQVGDLAIASEHHGAAQQGVVRLETLARNERQLGGASRDRGIGLLATRRDLTRAQTPVPGALAGPLDVDLHGPPRQVVTGPAQ